MFSNLLIRFNNSSLVFAFVLITNGLISQTPQLLKDCNPQNASSNQYGHTISGSYLFFGADDGINGEELWKTDGTEMGTMMVKNIGFEHFRSFPKELTDVNGTLFFTANDEKHGYELWKSNGTEVGTVLVKDINKGKSSSQPTCLKSFNQKLYFVINEGGHFSSVWSSDGTENGTVSIAKIQQSGSKVKIFKLLPMEDVLFLIGEINGKVAYWSLAKNSNDLSLMFLSERNNYQDFSEFAGVNNRLVMSGYDAKNGSELWVSNNQNNGAILLKDITSAKDGSMPNHFFSFSNKIYFTANNSKNETELWQTDGSVVGTKLVSKLKSFQNFFLDVKYEAEGEYLFLSIIEKNQILSAHEIYFHRTNTNELGKVGDFPLFDKENRIMLAQSHLLIKKSISIDEQLLIKMDVKSHKQSVISIKKYNAYRSHVYGLINFKNKTWMIADDGINGIELFSFQLSNNQLDLLKNINQKGLGSYASGFRKLGQKFTFFTSPESSRTELWISDGIEKNTHILKSFSMSDDDMIDGIIAMDGLLYFFKRNFNKYEFWQSDGTVNGTQLIQTINIGEVGTNNPEKKSKKDIQQFYPISIIAHKGQLFFNLFTFQSGNELWKFDSKQKGVVMLQDINKGSKSSDPSYFVVFKDYVFFNATTYNEGSELWRTDGNRLGGTVMVKDIWHGANNSTPAHFAIMGNHLYFAATSEKHGDELWKTDGTAAGTVFVKDINPGEEDSNPEDLTVVGQRLFFTANNGKQGTELWVSDGTGDGTKMVKDIYAGGESSSPKNLVAFNNALYFIAEDVDYGNELWVSDGTEKGTDLLNDIKKGRGHAFITELTIARNSLYFKAANGENNPELWKTNGKSSSTSMVEGSYSIENTLPPMNLFEFNGMLFYVVDDKKNGAEIWMVK